VIGRAGFINKRLNKIGFQLNRTTSLAEIKKFRQMLIPVENGIELVRAGSESDGGYLVPNDFEGLKMLISGGCDESWSFEKFFLDTCGLKVIIVDRESKKPKDLAPQVNYVDAWVGEGSDESLISISSLIENHASAIEPDLIMQLDIEGAEFTELLRIPIKDLLKFRILVVEFHGLERITNREFFRGVISPIFERITNNFDVVHSHANNCCGAINVRGEIIPRVLEVTFHQKSRSSGLKGERRIPHALDAPNEPRNNDVIWAKQNA
jgi:hypothetical protein